VRKLQGRGYFRKGQRLVLTLTGHGLKDPDLAIRVSSPAHTVEAEKDAVLKVLSL
jgi:threonine synthase